jgi:hypothetical protein
MSSCTENLPRHIKVFLIKLKLSSTDGHTTLRPLIKKSHEHCIGMLMFLKPPNITFWRMMFVFYYSRLFWGLDLFITTDEKWNLMYRCLVLSRLCASLYQRIHIRITVMQDYANIRKQCN